jgi:heptosyltransferase-3
MHRVEKDYELVSEFLALSPDIPPLQFEVPPGLDDLAKDKQPYAVIHPVSRWRRKAWPVENWVEVGRSLQAWGLHCIISSGPASDEVALADSICRELGDGASATRGQRIWPELARLIKHARLFVGLDTAAMHLAAACQCPVVALFGPSIEHHWHPWQSQYEIVSAGGMLHRNYPDFLYDAEKRSMSDIQVVDVIAACDRMLAQHPRPTA